MKTYLFRSTLLLLVTIIWSPVQGQKSSSQKTLTGTSDANKIIELNKAGHDRGAIMGLNLEIKHDPQVAQAQNNLGYSYYRLGLMKQAVEAFKRATELQPDLVTAHSNLGNTFTALGRYSEAIRELKQAARLDPDDPVTLCSLGVAYHKWKKYKEAIGYYRQAANIKHDYAEAHFNLASAYLKLGDRRAALAEKLMLDSLDSDLATELYQGLYKGKVLVLKH